MLLPRMTLRLWAEAQGLEQAGVSIRVLGEVWLWAEADGDSESLFEAQTGAVEVEPVAEPLAAVAVSAVLVVAVTGPHSAAPPLLPSLPPPKTSLEKGHRCRKEEKMQSEVAAASVVSSDLFSRLHGLVARS